MNKQENEIGRNGQASGREAAPTVEAPVEQNAEAMPAQSGQPAPYPMAPPPNAAPGGPWAPLPPAAPLQPKPVEPFTATRADGAFAIACLVLGFLFCRWVMPFAGWGVTAFTVLFGAVVLAYAKAREITPGRASWFWFVVMELCGLCYALWPAGLMAPAQGLLLVGSAVYWCAGVFGTLLAGRTGNWMPLDAINLLLLVPFKNFALAPRSLAALRRKKGAGEAHAPNKKRSLVLGVVVGLLLLVPLLAVVLPLLVRADSGNFGRLLGDFTRYLSNFFRYFWQNLRLWELGWQTVLGIPVALYLCGLIAGSAHRRYAKNIDLKKAQKSMATARVAPNVTVLMVLGVVAVVYVVFIGCQLPYFFSAFRGVKPQEYMVYSEYAREGFFELCRIAAINLGLLAVAGALAKRPARENTSLRVLNLVLAALTLLVIATAFSKMGLYIRAQGFTPKRIMTCVFMIFMAGVCVAVMVLQYKQFSIVRFAAVWGAGLLCALCLCNLDGMVVRYNAARYKDGSLESFDELILLRSGPAGYAAGLEIYEALDDKADAQQKLRLAYALRCIQQGGVGSQGTSRDNLTNARVRAMATPQVKSQRDAYNAFYKLYETQMGRGG